MIKYVSPKDLESIGPDRLTVDEYANLRDSLDDSYVIVVDPSENEPKYKPITLVKVGGEWVSKQLEFDFG